MNEINRGTSINQCVLTRNLIFHKFKRTKNCFIVSNLRWMYYVVFTVVYMIMNNSF